MAGSQRAERIRVRHKNLSSEEGYVKLEAAVLRKKVESLLRNFRRAPFVSRFKFNRDMNGAGLAYWSDEESAVGTHGSSRSTTPVFEGATSLPQCRHDQRRVHGEATSHVSEHRVQIVVDASISRTS